MAQITEFVGLLLLGEDEAFLGSAFPISEVHRLYLGVIHTIPTDRRGGLSIMIQNSPGRWGITKVVAVEALTGQPDVAVLQADDGLPPMSGLAAEEAFIWDGEEVICFHSRQRGRHGSNSDHARPGASLGGSLHARRPALEVGQPGRSASDSPGRQFVASPGDPNALALAPPIKQSDSFRVVGLTCGEEFCYRGDARRREPRAGVGNEPSRSLRGSGVVARLLRSELSAEHLSLSGLNP
jgi:hypothetical protein